MQGHSGNHKGRVLRSVFPYSIELLEPRLLMANVSWVGGPTGNWNVPSNWSSSPFLPGNTDDVSIPDGVIVTVNTDVPTIASLNAAHNLFGDIYLTAGSLTISNGGLMLSGYFKLLGGTLTASTAPSTSLSFALSTFEMIGGVLKGNLLMSVASYFTWTGGEMTSPGTTSAELSPIPQSNIGGSVTLSRPLIWDGRNLRVSGNMQMRNSATFDFVADGYGLDLSSATVTDGGGGINAFRVATGFLTLDGTSSVHARSEISGNVYLPFGGLGGSLNLLGGGTGDFALLQGTQVRVGGPGYDVTGLDSDDPENPINGQLLFDDGTSTFSGFADDVLVVGSLADLTFTGNSTLNELSLGTSTSTVVNPGTLNVSGDINLGSGANLTLPPGGNVCVRARAIRPTGPGGVINMGDNVVIVDYPTKNLQSTFDDVRALLTTGYNNGAWNGPGINSSVAAGNPRYGLGYAASSSLFSSFPAIFAGQQVDSTAVLVRYTRYGDANLDRIVNINDFTRLASGFGQSATVWTQGNFNYDNFTNINDFTALAANFGLTAADAGFGSGAREPIGSLLRELL